MFIINTTYQVKKELADKYMNWAKKIYIPQVMESKILSNPKLMEIHSENIDTDFLSYAIQFEIDNLYKLEYWFSLYGNKLKDSCAKTFGEKVLAFSTVMETIELNA